ncbi:MAG: c-type cytochrome, partial [Solirubrobacteraceae bacterium]
ALAACGGDGDGGAPPEPAGGPVEQGRQVFAREGCGSCHTLAAADADGSVGPNLDEALKGRDRGFIRTSIVDPDAVVEEGFNPGVMPGDYADNLDDQELDQLVELLFQTAAQN